MTLLHHLKKALITNILNWKYQNNNLQMRKNNKIILVDSRWWWRLRMAIACTSAGFEVHNTHSVNDVRAAINSRQLFGEASAPEYLAVVIGPKARGTNDNLAAMYFAVSGKTVCVNAFGYHAGLVLEALRAKLLAQEDHSVKIQFEPWKSNECWVYSENTCHIEAYQVWVVLGFWLWKRSCYQKEASKGRVSFFVPKARGSRIWPARLLVQIDGRTRLVSPTAA